MLSEIKNICCIGAGYVGGPSMAVIADKCHFLKVTVVDIDSVKIDNWNNSNLDKLPVYEPGLREIIERRRGKNLFFSSDVNKTISDSDMIFISVNTPTKTKGLGAGEASDLKYIESSARQIAKYAKDETIIVEKSTIPVKTAETIQKILETSKKPEESISGERSVFHVLSNPEFLAEGTAISDLFDPNRVLIGGENERAIKFLYGIYENWIAPEKILTTNIWSSELSKLTANAFLAQRVSSINSISALCEVTGANVSEVSKAVGMDNRIGKDFLKAGPGFGGSCFKKDILNLIYISKFYGLFEVASYWESILEINKWQQERISKIIVTRLFGNLSEKKIGILGFAFKANTNDTRESPALYICKDLIEEGAKLSIYDPKVNDKKIRLDMQKIVTHKNHKNINTTNCLYEVANNSDAIVILTDWDEFKKIDWHNINRTMRSPAWIFDCRNILNKSDLNKTNLNLWQLGNNL